MNFATCAMCRKACPSLCAAQALIEEIEAMIKKRIAEGVFDDVIR